LENRSLSEMKTLLEELGLSHADCLEKSDLVNKLKRYYTTQDLKNSQFRETQVPKQKRTHVNNNNNFLWL